MNVKTSELPKAPKCRFASCDCHSYPPDSGKGCKVCGLLLAHVGQLEKRVPSLIVDVRLARSDAESASRQVALAREIAQALRSTGQFKDLIERAEVGGLLPPAQ